MKPFWAGRVPLPFFGLPNREIGIGGKIGKAPKGIWGANARLGLNEGLRLILGLIDGLKETLGLIDFSRMDYGDPWEEFMRVTTFSKSISSPFAIGQINGYFDKFLRVFEKRCP